MSGQQRVPWSCRRSRKIEADPARPRYLITESGMGLPAQPVALLLKVAHPFEAQAVAGVGLGQGLAVSA